MAESTPPSYVLIGKLDTASRTIFFLKQAQNNVECYSRAAALWTGVLSGQWSSGAACIPGVF